ncbi:lipopolysaccharide biosynthesis protein [Anaerotalea alkaliphila]|uniref:Lipopolysaccharide biosynthesis protein n=1 Tax=Anaerotalea alkaliphila TaxID=2662126 RepID=A0A7X5HU79_9FIRM|nr:lipopolysaccharide biosynthesis protein [Anaerotalea alkaliphila]NDL66506.1 lipopolysaccharide biosynthesis protein [Anaerotalea alkaliphila]
MIRRKLKAIRKKVAGFQGSMLGYLPVKVAEGVIGILTVKVYTTLFPPEVYGEYTMVNTTVNILFLTLLGWLMQAAIRYIKGHTGREEDKRRFFSTVYLTMAGAYGLLFLLVLGAKLLLPGFLEGYGPGGMLVLALMMAGYGSTQLLLAILLYMEHRVKNIAILLFNVTGKLALTVLAYNRLGPSVWSILLSHAAVDMVSFLGAFLLSGTWRQIRWSGYDKETVRDFMRYGYPLIGFSFVMALLNMSDRYIIRFFQDRATVGIYTSNYAIPSSVFMMLMMGLSRGVYPKLLKAHYDQDRDRTARHLKTGAALYLSVSMPAAMGIAVLHRHLSSLFLGKEYMGGSPVMAYVAGGMLFYGLAEYCNKGWELTANTLPILKKSFLAAMANILVNLLLVPRWGYMVAAASTLGGYLLFFLASYRGRNPAIPFDLRIRELWPLFLATGTMGAALLVVNRGMEITLASLLINVMAGIIIYFGVLAGTGFLGRLLHRMREV